MTGVEFVPFIYALPVAMAMFARSDRHASISSSQRRNGRHPNQRRRRQEGWTQSQQVSSNHAREIIMATSPSRSPPPLEPTPASIEVTLEEFRM